MSFARAIPRRLVAELYPWTTIASGFKRMFLHAQRLIFRHPLTQETMTVEAPLAVELRAFLERLERIGN